MLAVTSSKAAVADPLAARRRQAHSAFPLLNARIIPLFLEVQDWTIR